VNIKTAIVPLQVLWSRSYCSGPTGSTRGRDRDRHLTRNAPGAIGKPRRCTLAEAPQWPERRPASGWGSRLLNDLIRPASERPRASVATVTVRASGTGRCQWATALERQLRGRMRQSRSTAPPGQPAAWSVPRLARTESPPRRLRARDAADDWETKRRGSPCSAQLADHNEPHCAAVGEQRPDRSSSQRKGSAEGDSELEQRLVPRHGATVPTGKRVGHWDATKGQNASGSDVASPADQETSAGSTRAADVARARL
jgi:hypothetical protein